ncbi:Shedu anti-phage system protein SduA domain-containing protein [Mycolicibacterium sp. 018/SC-01/001]|uniref:Shedu anti-phage system protein SduA domain-containing protein n=1 Tax=Mycolicibacterium sp. 018/SC-01/001 TaxID=2592069 RepID=UPI00163DC7A2|nr:Shedu anti-phage system protein SduA domain-containing protein [Mycolicibacterium sp. 018/SC-01/001]
MAEKMLNGYFEKVQSALSRGYIRSDAVDPVPSFPQSIVVTETPHHFAVELIGARTTPKRMRVVKRELAGVDEFLGQFEFSPESKPMINVVGNSSSFNSIAITTAAARSELERRFPGVLQLFPSQLSFMGDTFGTTIRVQPEANFFQLNDMLLANSLDRMVRIRHIRFALLVTRETTAEILQTKLEEILTVANGSSIVGFALLPRGEAEVVHRAAQFANLFLMNKLRETSIGTFIDQHREIILTALGASDLVSEPSLDWQVQPLDPEETAINPDLFIQREDAFWDVYDLKLALLDKKSVTTSSSRRRRFVYTIEDGIAQLAHYKEFLDNPQNARHAEEKYGVRFNEPRYTLIVGNYENIDSEKVRQAQLRLGNFEIVDYDSLLQLYLIKSGVESESKDAPI